MPQSPRIVITGLGLQTAFGAREDTWSSICAGLTATRFLDEAGHLGAPAKVTSGSEPILALAEAAVAEALSNSALTLSGPRGRCGIVFGTSKGGLHTFDRLYRSSAGADASFLHCFANAPARHLAQIYDIRGPALAMIAACATGLVCAVRAAQLIADGTCDVVVTGSSDASLLPVLLASYKRLGVLSREREQPSRACRPFDRTRSGFVVGEGAGALVLESAEHAARRGAEVLAEWRGGAVGSDPADLTRLASTPESLVRLIKDVLHQGQTHPADVDYINLHGTGTQQNDVYESRAVQAVFGTATAPPCSAQKGAIGHLMGAAGSVELVLTVLALSRGLAPPTANLENRDPSCPLDYIVEGARALPIASAMKLSLGFGGHLAAVLLGRPA